MSIGLYVCVSGCVCVMFACISGRARVCTPLLRGSGQTVHSCGGTQAEHLETEVSQQRLLSPRGDMIGLVSFGPCGGTPRSVCARVGVCMRDLSAKSVI